MSGFCYGLVLIIAGDLEDQLIDLVKLIGIGFLLTFFVIFRRYFVGDIIIDVMLCRLVVGRLAL